jgi:serine/threonine protein kinase
MRHRNIVNYVEDWTEVRPTGWKYSKEVAVNLNNAEKVHFVLMEYCAQGDLVNWCQQQRDPSEIKEIFAQIVDAVAFFHSMGVLHRDMKLANCFITEEGQVKVGDFGLSTEYAEMMTSRPGTELYRAPEIVST